MRIATAFTAAMLALGAPESVSADPLSDGQCVADETVSSALRNGENCLQNGWDQFTSCADREANPGSCVDATDSVSVRVQRLMGMPTFATRNQAHAWCNQQIGTWRAYGFADADIDEVGWRRYGFDEFDAFRIVHGRITAYRCPDGKPHALISLFDNGVWFCSGCGKFVRLPEHTSFSVSVWGPKDIPNDQ